MFVYVVCRAHLFAAGSSSFLLSPLPQTGKDARWPQKIDTHWSHKFVQMKRICTEMLQETFKTYGGPENNKF